MEPELAILFLPKMLMSPGLYPGHSHTLAQNPLETIILFYLWRYKHFAMPQPGSLRPLRTVRAAFVAYGSSTFKALPAKGYPAVCIGFRITKSSDLFTFFC